MKRIFMSTMLLIALLFPLIAQESATISELSGKVEIQTPGGGWTAASVGQQINRGTTVSTGFGAFAVLDLGSSEVQVKQLTRLTLEDLIEEQGNVTTSLFLRVGKVRASVKTGEGLTHDFQLRSPVSTAAVRGTELDYDGFRLLVIEGTVNFFTELSRRSVDQGEELNTTGDDIDSVVESNEKRYTVSLRTGGSGDDDDDDEGDQGTGTTDFATPPPIDPDRSW